MEPLTWTSQYPSGIMVVDEEGKVEVPKANSHQTVVNTAQSRGLDLINTGSTHKLKPMVFEIETFANLTRNNDCIWLVLITILILLAIVINNGKRISVLLKKYLF